MGWIAGCFSTCCSEEEWVGELAVPLTAVLKRNWLDSWLFLYLLLWRGMGWRASCSSTCCSEEEWVGELAPSLAVHGPEPDLVLCILGQPCQLHVKCFLKKKLYVQLTLDGLYRYLYLCTLYKCTILYIVQCIFVEATPFRHGDLKFFFYFILSLKLYCVVALSLSWS